MKINRSSQCTLKFATSAKRQTLSEVLDEYAGVVNHFIALFWDDCPSKGQLLKPLVDTPTTWLSARMRKVAAREAIDMIKAAKKRWADKAKKPAHSRRRMCVSTAIAKLETARCATFDCWLHLASIGSGVILDLPIKLHQHINRLFVKGKRLESYIITRNSVQLCFAIETGPKQTPDRCVGIDTGMNALASLSHGKQFGRDIKAAIARIQRCQHGSKGQKRAAAALRQRMNEVSKEVASRATLVVVENLTGITQHTKRRLVKNRRRSIGRWNVRYWLGALERACEENRVSFRSVCAHYTSQTCSVCGHVDRRNRRGEVFRCLECGHEDNADVQASRNILARFLTGPYGAGCKPLMS